VSFASEFSTSTAIAWAKFGTTLLLPPSGKAFGQSLPKQQCFRPAGLSAYATAITQFHDAVRVKTQIRGYFTCVRRR
jgi:hypothetical protein